MNLSLDTFHLVLYHTVFPFLFFPLPFYLSLSLPLFTFFLSLFLALFSVRHNNLPDMIPHLAANHGEHEEDSEDAPRVLV